MSEGHQFIGLVIAVVLQAVFAVLYRLGGWKDTVWRRYVGGGVFSVGMNLNAAFLGSWHLLMLLSLVAVPAWLTMGYGGRHTTSAKARRRALFGLVGGLAVAVPFCVPAGLWGVLIIQLLLAVGLSLYYGLRNPISAVGEEGTLGSGYVFPTVFSVIR